MRAIALALLLFAIAPALRAQDANSSLPYHPLERRALVEPDAVLTEIPPLLRTAERQGNSREAALLLLARANACRVVADWGCQRQSAALARAQAKKAGDGILAIRGLILESRADIGLQDYTRAEGLLGEAELALRTTPSSELAAEVDLAYSSLSYSLGKHELARKYAEQGIAQLREGEALALRVRLLRNQGRALAYLGRVDEGRALVSRRPAQLRGEPPRSWLGRRSRDHREQQQRRRRADGRGPRQHGQPCPRDPGGNPHPRQ